MMLMLTMMVMIFADPDADWLAPIQVIHVIIVIVMAITIFMAMGDDYD